MWEEKMLKELGTIITGNTPPTVNRDYYGDKYKFIKPTDMTEGLRYVFKTEEMLSELAYERYKKSIIPSNTPCVVTIGSLGKKMCLTNEPSFTNQAVNSILVNSENDGRFIYYLMKLMLPTVKHLSSGTASGRENVSKSSFSNIKVKVPPLSTQQKIADILSAYDDLIENNNRRIELLEQAAQQLYKEWFVRFRFPGHEKVHFTKGIPDGWEEIQLGEVVDIRGGKRLPAGKNLTNIPTKYPYIKIKDMTRNKYLIKNYDFEYVDEETRHEIKNYTTQTNDIIISIVGTIGLVNIIDESLNNASLTENCVKFINIKQVNKNYLYYLLTSEYGKGEINSGTVGATQPKLPLYNIKRIKLLKPEGYLLTEFDRIVYNFDIETISLQSQNQNLIKQRDLLLPRLMSGKLEVSDGK